LDLTAGLVDLVFMVGNWLEIFGAGGGIFTMVLRIWPGDEKWCDEMFGRPGWMGRGSSGGAVESGMRKGTEGNFPGVFEHWFLESSGWHAVGLCREPRGASKKFRPRRAFFERRRTPAYFPPVAEASSSPAVPVAHPKRHTPGCGGME
jgi:hypothetical protein